VKTDGEVEVQLHISSHTALLAALTPVKGPLRVSENMVLRRIFGPRRDEVTGEWRRLHNGS
jgi:hypothetical protein